MDLVSLYLFASVGILLLFLFTLAEVAMRQIGPAFIELELSENKDSLIGFLLRREEQLMPTIKLGLGLSLLLLGLALMGIFTTLLQPHLRLEIALPLAGVLVLLLSWTLSLGMGMVASVAPPVRLLRFIVPPLTVFFILLSPFTYALLAVFGPISSKEDENRADLMGNALALQPFAARLQTQEEKMLTPSSEVDSKIFHNALQFKTVKVRECMVPRTEIDAIELEEGVEVLRQAFIETGHSKILIYQYSLDHILGYCHQFSLFNNPASLEEILTPMEAVPENMLAKELFVKFITEHRSIVLVLDEFGGTSGVVTLEDVMEEILGDINDEYDEEDLLEQPLPEPGAYLFSARQEIDYLNEKYELNLPEGDYETLGGFILSVLEEIPATGDVVVVPPFEIRILSMDEHRINTVHLSRKSAQIEE